VGDVFTPAVLVDGYAHGIFPWPFPDYHNPQKHHTGWFSPDPRCIFEFETFHIPKRLKSVLNSGKFEIRCDTDFRRVITYCAANPHRLDGSWITPPMLAAYVKLHQLGIAHSVEAYHKGRLAGGVYGIALRGLFAAESMFYLEPDASKVALAALVERLKRQGFQLLDIQAKTDNTARFGAAEISRTEYLQRLHQALQVNIEF
ncbi:MAG: leucyl/phenylalanyl-tRNA--protein transferase, partial [Planctomycetaceae bacterium]|nr:leucyl/phenylalanyl-tRNA--protein transferase [Planctomycetaceae bacterium]